MKNIFKTLCAGFFILSLSPQALANNNLVTVKTLLKNGFEIKTMMHTKLDNTHTSIILQSRDTAYLCKVKIYPENETGKTSVCYKIR